MNDTFIRLSRIAKVWYTFTLLILAIAFIQTLANKYGVHTKKMWSWISTSIFPTLTVIIAFHFKLKKKTKLEEITDSQFNIAMALSFFYLLPILLILLVEPLFSRSLFSFVDDLQIMNGFLQGLITLSIVRLYKFDPKNPTSD